MTKTSIMGGSSTFRDLIVDGKRLAWPENAFVRLVDGDYEFVLKQSPVSYLLPLTLGERPQARV